MRLTYWNCKEKGSALPVAINENGDTVDLETVCAKLAAYEDTCLTPEEVSDLMIANGEKAQQLTRLRAELERMERERDAAVADIEQLMNLTTTNHACLFCTKRKCRIIRVPPKCIPQWRGTGAQG